MDSRARQIVKDIHLPSILGVVPMGEKGHNAYARMGFRGEGKGSMQGQRGGQEQCAVLRRLTQLQMPSNASVAHLETRSLPRNANAVPCRPMPTPFVAENHDYSPRHRTRAQVKSLSAGLASRLK